MTTPNAEHLTETLDYIRANPDVWNQNDWSTCFAGIAYSLLHGNDPADVREMPNVAEVRDWLGVDQDSHNAGAGLFNAAATLSELERIVTELTGS